MYVERWGSGPDVVLVHGGGAGGAANFAAQRPLAERWTLVLPDRPGHGRTPARGRVDFAADAPLVAELLGAGAHLVGHSYGGVVALLAAALRPEAVRSLTLVEPAAFAVGRGHPDVDGLELALRDLFADPPADGGSFMARFFELNGIPGPPPPALPPAAYAAMLGTRGPWEAEIPVEEVAAADIPKLVVSGGHHPAFETIADRLAAAIGARRAVVRGQGHAVQAAGEPFNARLEEMLLEGEAGAAAGGR
jgi:pimeloyl-ACP methyl ester carboxylesterase